MRADEKYILYQKKSIEQGNKVGLRKDWMR